MATPDISAERIPKHRRPSDGSSPSKDKKKGVTEVLCKMNGSIPGLVADESQFMQIIFITKLVLIP